MGGDLSCEWTLVHSLRVDGMKQVNKFKRKPVKNECTCKKGNEHTFPLTHFEKQSYKVISS